MIYENINLLIGNTPILKYPTNINNNQIYLKLEMYNYSNSIKIRPVYFILEKLKNEKKLENKQYIVEASSGNTAIALCTLSKSYNLIPILVIPKNTNKKRKDLIKKMGGKIIEKENMSECLKEVEKIIKTDSMYIALNQFNSIDNVNSHTVTALEIINDFSKIDYFICGIGTGGSITGISKKLKSHYKKMKTIGIEPFEKNVISGTNNLRHSIPGIGAGFIPSILDLKVVDEIVSVKSRDAKKMFNKNMKEEKIFVGISSSASIYYALELAKSVSNKIILVICSDSGFLYV